MRQAQKIIKKVSKLPPLNQAAKQMVEVLNDPDHSVREVVEVVKCDAAMTSTILKTVNSAAFGLVAHVPTVERAIPYLGEQTVGWIALSSCTDRLYCDPLPGYEAEKNALWDHSLYTALCARELSRYTGGKVNPELAYTAGLLHDLGKSVIAAYLQGTTRELVDSLDAEDSRDFLEAEQAMVGIDHCQVGAAIAAHWSLTPKLQAAAHHHHMPGRCLEEHRGLVYLVHLGDIMVMLAGIGTGADVLKYHLDEAYRDYVEIPQEQLEEVVLKIRIEFEAVRKWFFSKDGDDGRDTDE